MKHDFAASPVPAFENTAHSRETGMGNQDDERSWDHHKGLRMSNNGQPEKYSSFVQSVRQKLIDELIAVSNKWKVGEDGSNFEKLREERLAVLNRYEQQKEDDVAAIHTRFDKARTFRALNELPGGCAALRPLLGHREIAVRVSAATYLLLSAPQLALPVLQEVAET